ncbi:MAG: hypothetical protein WAO61_09440 [Solirubrobacterales bacterium]
MGYGELETSEELDWAGLLSKFMELTGEQIQFALFSVIPGQGAILLFDEPLRPGLGAGDAERPDGAGDDFTLYFGDPLISLFVKEDNIEKADWKVYENCRELRFILGTVLVQMTTERERVSAPETPDP